MTTCAQASAPSAEMTELANPKSRLATADSRLPAPAFHDPKHHIKIYQGDCLEILAAIPPDCVDLIFAGNNQLEC
jgi:hypothetical protein